MAKSSKENPKFLLYKLEPKLERLEVRDSIDQKVKEEYIQKLFSENLENIFSELVSLKTSRKDNECRLKHPTQEKHCEIDTLAFDTKNNIFLIIEYKARQASDLIHQVREYMECLEDDEKNYKIFKTVHDNKYKLLKLLDKNEILSKKRSNKDWEEKEIV